MKLFAFLSALVLLSTGAFADGVVGFQNSITTEIYLFDYATMTTDPITSATLGSQDGIGQSTGVLDVGLVWGTTASSVSTIYGGTLAGVVNIKSTSAGQISGSSSFNVPGANPGDSDYFQVYMWDSSFGNTLAGLQACVAAGGYFGAASAGFGNTVYGAVGAALVIKVNQSPAPGVPLFNTSGNAFGKTIVLTTPEPATIAIGGLGAAALLLFRRRK